MLININGKKIKIKKCIDFKSRLLGLMFKKDFNYGLLFENCNMIHTMFMRKSIDVLGLDKNNIVIDYKKDLKPYRFLRIKNAKKIIELPCNSINENILNKKIKL